MLIFKKYSISSYLLPSQSVGTYHKGTYLEHMYYNIKMIIIHIQMLKRFNHETNT